MSQAVGTSASQTPALAADPAATVRLAFQIDPVDVLFFGQTFATTSWRDVDSGPPSCQTFHGAMFSYLLRCFGCDFDKLGEVMRQSGSLAEAIEAAGGDPALALVQTRGPWFAKRSPNTHPDTLKPLVACPADLVRLSSDRRSTARLKPVKADPNVHANLPNGLHLLDTDHPDAAQALPTDRHLLRAEALAAYLDDQPLPGDALVAVEDVVCIERRRLVRRSVDRYTVEQGGYFQKGFLRLLPGYALYGELHIPALLVTVLQQLPDSFALRLGGENRFCRLSRTEPISWPGSDSASIRSGKARLKTLAVSPCCFGSAQLIPATESLKCVAMASPGRTTISGWDYAQRRAKPARDLLLPGTVHFWKIEDQTNARSPLQSSEADDRLGFNHLLQGTWSWL